MQSHRPSTVVAWQASTQLGEPSKAIAPAYHTDCLRQHILEQS